MKLGALPDRTIPGRAIGLGSYDLGVATAAELYHRVAFALIAFTGSKAPTTVERCPGVRPSTTASPRRPSARRSP